MDDLINRQTAIDALDVLCQEHRYRIPGKRETYSQYNEAWQDALGRAENAIGNLPSAQPKERTEERTETHACDLIDREAAVDAIYHHLPSVSRTRARTMLHEVPSAQPEIVRCGQCKYAEVADAQDNQDGYTCQFHRGSIWFSGSYCSWGERKSDEQV